MGRIKKIAGPKHDATLSPALSSFLDTGITLPLHRLPPHLFTFPRRWPFPRGDLYNWIPLLNRFDTVLELFNKEYGLVEGPQTQSFGRRLLCRGDGEILAAPEVRTTEQELNDAGYGPEGDRELVEAILGFSVILLENCSNRSLYASSTHLNDILNSTSLSLLSTALRLGVRLAQRYHASRQRSVGSAQSINSALLQSHYNINLEKVQKLASPFVKTLPPSSGPRNTSTPTTPSAKGKEKSVLFDVPQNSSAATVNASNLVDLAKERTSPSLATGSPTADTEQQDISEQHWEEWGGVWLTYYVNPSNFGDDRNKAVTQGAGVGVVPTSPGTPTPARRTSGFGSHQSQRQRRLSNSDESPSVSFSKLEEISSTAAKTLEIPYSRVSTIPPFEILRATLPSVPKESHYDLLARLRVAWALSTSSSSRRQILAIRILAVTNLAYIYPETVFQQKLLQQDSDEPRRLQLPYQLAELVHSQGSSNSAIPRNIQVLALGALEALTKHKSKAPDVCTALGVNVNHGILLYVLRRAIADFSSNDLESDTLEEDEYRDALFTLLASLPAATPRTGDMLVSAGLLSILVEILTIRTFKAERNYHRVLSFLDGFVYNVRDAFQALTNIKGLDAVADLTSYEVETAMSLDRTTAGMPHEYRTQATDYEIPYFQQQTLRWLFKFINHMMSHTGGNFDRELRNLIDSPHLLRALRTVIANAKVFGAVVWSSAINIMSNFIHNEPTSYAVIAEAGLSKYFLEAITGKEIDVPEDTKRSDNHESEAASPEESSGHISSSRTTQNHPETRIKVLEPRTGPLAQGILPHGDAIATVPQAFGAICLNSAGMKLFQASGALDSFFEIFESPEHVKNINSETDLAGILGSSFDELVRHHPPLKGDVMGSVLAMVVRVGELCRSKARVNGIGSKLWLENTDGESIVAGGWQALQVEQGPFHKKEQDALDKAKEEKVKDDSEDVEMSDPGSGPTDNTPNRLSAGLADVIETEDEPTVCTYVDVVVKFLAGFFNNHTLCSQFVESGGGEYVLDLTTLPSLPYDFFSQSAGHGTARVVQMMAEQKPHLILPSVIKRTQKAVDILLTFRNHNGVAPFFASLTIPRRGPSAIHDPNPEADRDVQQHGTHYVKSLVIVHTLCNVVYECFSSPQYNQRSSQTIFHQVNLADMYIKLTRSLGELHRACIWEEVLLQRHLPDHWKEATRGGLGLGGEDIDDVLGMIRSTEQALNLVASGTGTQPPSSQEATQSRIPDTESKNKSQLEEDEKSAQFKNVRTLQFLLSQIPESVTAFYQGLGKVIIAKRQPEPYHKQNGLMVAEAIAEALLDQLRFPALEKSRSTQDRYSYWIVTLRAISHLIIEGPNDRPHPQCLTLVLQAFKNKEGFKAINTILDKFYNEVQSTAESENQASKSNSVHLAAYGGIRIILSMFAQITTARNIVDSSQTIAITSRERDKDKPDYFSPAQFMVELRMAVLPTVRTLWKSDFVDKADSSIVKSLIEILRTILLAEHEQGAYKRNDKVPPRGKAPFKAWKQMPAMVSQLTDRGFDVEIAKEALYRCNNNVLMAREYCQTQKDHMRITRNPIPSYDQEGQSAVSTWAEASMAPPPGPIRNSVLLDNPLVEVEEADGDGSPSRSGSPPPPPPAPGLPVDDDFGEDQGLLAMSIDNILGSLGHGLNRPPPDEVIGTGNSSPSPSPNRGSVTEAGRLPDLCTVDDLDVERSEIRKDLIDRSLDVLNVHSDVTFELAELIQAAVTKSGSNSSMRREVGETLVQSLQSLQLDEDFRPAGKKIAAYAHLLALILQDKEFYEATLDELKENYSMLLAFIKVFPDQATEQSSPWIGQILLIIEKLLAEDAQPKQIKWTSPTLEDSRVPSPLLEHEPLLSLDQKQELFSAVLEVLPRVGKDAALALSVIRVLVSLTRSRQLAARLGEKRNMQRLFVMMKQLAGTTSDRLQSAFMLVLRHVIEDEETIKQIMKSEIRAMFMTRQQRNTDTNGYVRQMYHLVLRAPEIFVEATNETLKLARFDSGVRPQILSLKEEKSKHELPEQPTLLTSEDNGVLGSEEDIKPSTEADSDARKGRPAEIKPPVVEHPDGVIHYILCELLSYKDVDDKESSSVKDAAKEDVSSNIDAPLEASSSTNSSPALAPIQDSKKSEKQDFKVDQHPIYIYRCFLLQCLTELLSCYNRTKIEFINFSRKADPLATTPSKPRSGVLNYLLNALIPIGTLSHAEDILFRKKYATSNWAISTIVALCSKTGERGYERSRDIAEGEEESDLLFVRKFVLEHALKAYKDACSSPEGLDIKYGRMLNLADLFNRMLTGKPNSGGSNIAGEMLVSSQRQLSRIMFEKNFISVLTSSIADIDLNFPGAKRSVKYILRPLRLLTQTALELSESSAASTTPGQTDEDEISSASSVSDIDDDREETPDLFRNSTLGMLEPGREDETSSESLDEEDDEMYDDDYGDEMDYEEEMAGDDGEVVSDEDEDIEGMGPIEGMPGDVGMDVEVVIDGEDDDEDDDDSEDDEDEEDDESDVMDDDDIDGPEEVTGDDNGSLIDGDDDEWESEEEDDGFDEDGVHPDDLADHRHDSPLESIVRALEGGAGEMIEQLESGDLDMDLDPEDYLEDEMHDDEEEDEEDEEDIDGEDAIYEHEFEDEDPGMANIPWGWDADTPVLRGHPHHHHVPRGPMPWPYSPWSTLNGGGHREMLMPNYRSHRPGAAGRGTDDGVNPLLHRASGPSGSSAARSPRGEPMMSDWVNVFDRDNAGRGGIISADSPVSLINTLISAMGQSHHGGFGPLSRHGGALHFHITGGPGGILPPEIQGLLGGRRTIPEPSRPSRDDPAQAVSFVPTVTATRWQEAARILFGMNYIDKAQNVMNSLLRVLVPPAIEEEKLRREKAAEAARKIQEEQARLAEEERLAKEKAEKDAEEKRHQEEQEAAVKAAAEVEAITSHGQGEGQNAQAGPSEEAYGENSMEGVESTGPAETQGAGPSQPAARVYTTIRGRQLDITDMQIDPEYLEALPEELREEVIMHQLAEQRSQAVAASEEPSDISREFLEALPADIREELLQQEAQDRRRREREEARRRAAASGSAPIARAEDIDTASFFATLDPGLRQAVLMDQDEEVLAQLPSSIAAEARALGGDRRLHQFMDLPRIGRGGRGADNGGNDLDRAAKKAHRAQVIQMFDKAGIATLLRLMFVPHQGSIRHTLHGILQNASENRQNRAEVVSLLLSILQDGSADLNAVERSFAQLSLRARQPASQKTPQPVKRTSSEHFHPTNAEMSPQMVIQQCLSSLVFLTQYNPHIPSFFLTEHEPSAGLKGRINRKGKGKESKSSKYALNALLSLLDRKLVIESSNVMEQLSSLLNSITHPLTMLFKRDREVGVASHKTEQEADRIEGDDILEQPQLEQSTEALAPSTDIASGAATPEGKTGDARDVSEDKTKKLKNLVPPVVPEYNLRLVINILAARECSAKTFRDTLSTINNLSAIPDAKEVFGNELIKKAQDLAQSILRDLDDLISQIKSAKSGTDVQGVALAKFSPASSDQAKLLRVLTALDYLFDPKKTENKDKSEDSEASKVKDDLLPSLYEKPTFANLWSKLSECLGAMRQRSNMLNVATILLPLIEALMVVCKNTTLKDVPLYKASQREFTVTTPPPETRMETLFFNFTEEHRKILNDLVRQNPKLMSGTFSLLVKNPKVLEFDNKRNYFTRRLHTRTETRQPQPPLQLQVRRDQVFLDSFKSLYFKSGEEMKYGKLNIRFHGEEGVDAGGVTREWFQVLSRQMFNPDYALFIPVASDRTTFHPNRLSSVNQEHLMFFKFIGRIIGKALYEGRVLDCHFSRAVYKRILGKPVSIKDMETLDLDYYKSLLWMLENDITDIITETFSVETEAFGEVQIIDLIENGRNIPVTEENKHEYVRLVVEYRLTGSVQEQLENFLKGFHDIIPAELIAIFNEQELELLISGLPDIDVDDWKNNTEYHNYSASSSQIQWFWRAVRSFDKEERAKLLQFVTGTSKVPLNGFKELEGMHGFSRFNIHRDYGNKDRLPSSHTCFNQLDLPEYESYEVLRERLYTAITAGSEYFGFA